MSLERQRVASPFISEAIESLRLYKAIEPDTWGRMIGRVNGVNFSAIYGGTHAMGYVLLNYRRGIPEVLHGISAFHTSGGNPKRLFKQVAYQY